jgi:RNA polymerase sigma factor (sigma-70 family)
VRELAPQVLGAVIRRFHDFATAEDAVQEALMAAVVQWPREGVPDNPRGWLIHVASRRMTDHVRTEMARRRRESELALEAVTTTGWTAIETSPEEDDTLVLLFMCCHPALTLASAIALTLRAVGGLTTEEIAHAFLVPEATMAQRISRAKQSIKESGIPFQLPTSEERAQRLRALLHVLYLIFNEGYTSSAGPHLQRGDLSREAMRLTRIVHALQPDDAEVIGLLALMLLTDARRLARVGTEGELITLAQQDRALWDKRQIVEGVALLSYVTERLGRPIPIASRYRRSSRRSCPSRRYRLATNFGALRSAQAHERLPMVGLNHAVAAAMVHGPTKGLELVDALKADARVANHHRLDAVRAHLLEMAGDRDGAVKHYRAAASKTLSLPERNYLLMQGARLSRVDGQE